MGLVRRAGERDIPEIMRLLVQVDMVHHMGRPDLFKGPATKYDETALARIVADDNRPVFVYIAEDETLVAHAFCAFKQTLDDAVMTDIKTLYIDDICVDEAARGQGVGRVLFEHVKRFAAEEGCYNVTLNVWTCNPGAMRFYEEMGMKPQKIGMEIIL